MATDDLPRRPLKVLIVDDSADDRDLLLLELGRARFDLRWQQVASAEALREALTGAWDLILCDYHMPGFGALPALQIVREAGCDLPFIIVSGVLGEEAAVAAMKAGAHDFFPKSRLARLGAAIERELAEAQVRRDRREAERAKDKMFLDLQQALRARDEFLVLASHEFRTPLTIIRLQAEGLNRKLGASGNGERRWVERLDRQVERLAAMIERLLDVTMLSSDPLRLLPERTDLKQLVLEIVDRTRELTEQAGCPVDVERVGEVVGWWDPVRLDSVLTNLLANAIKYGPGKPVTIELAAHGQGARLSVRDQGIGLSPDERANLFQKFSRAVPVDNYGGFGFGLWIVDQVVRAHGGTVEIDSRKGEGATFTVQLPLGGPPAAPA